MTPEVAEKLAIVFRTLAKLNDQQITLFKAMEALTSAVQILHDRVETLESVDGPTPRLLH